MRHAHRLLLGLKQMYGLRNIKFVPLADISAYTAARPGEGARRRRLHHRAAARHRKYTVLTDTKHIFGFQNVAPVVSKKLVAEYGAEVHARR